jgi:hypothetical protein
MAKKSGTKPVKSSHKSNPHKGARRHAAPKAEKKSAEGKTAAAKKVSQALLDSIEKRKQAKTAAAAKPGGIFGRPAGRRGRRPKRLQEYTPQNSEEGGEELEGEAPASSDYAHIEYDTGIRVEKGGDDSGLSLDGYDFDEVLNFDR